MTINATIKGYLIDPKAKTITRVSLPDNKRHRHLDSMYRLIECGTVDVVRMPNNTDCWIDDEGLFKPDEEQHFFALNIGDGEPGMGGSTCWRAYVGKGLVLGCDDSETISATIDEAELLRRVRFYNARAETVEEARASVTSPQRIEEGATA